jgi:hypothetical protein
LQRQDYIIKQINQLGKVLSKLLADVLGLKHDLKITEADSIVNSVFEKELGFNFDEFLAIKDAQFIPFLISNKFDLASMEELANLFFEIGTSSTEKEKQIICFSKAKIIYNHLNTERKTFSFEFMTKLNAMENQIQANEI